MFREDYLTICENGRKKLDFFRSRPFGYFLSAMLAGMFIALGSFAAMCIGGFATAVYAGVPAANRAFAIARETLNEDA